ncbi:DNA repair protein RadC [Parelusimicrobium proximum]|uniref:RadC family protein n=1 Tax=Parelusimicrobium proximum TaxID=3228953 RepID=UPI003D16E547
MSEKHNPSYLGHRDRIKKKFAENGIDSFQDHETLELLLTYSIPRRDTKPLAWALIKKFGSLSSVLDADAADLAKVKGIGRSTAMYLHLVRSVFKKYSMATLKQGVTIRTPEDVATYCRTSLQGKNEEVFEVIYLTIRNTVIGSEIVSVGTIDRTSISPRKVLERALAAKASGIVLVHNHPSGDPSPSNEDISFTRDVIKAAAILSISVHDHIIVGKNGYCSLRAKGII